MKKYLAILLSVVLMLSLAVPAFAATITIDNPVDGVSYTAYYMLDGNGNLAPEITETVLQTLGYQEDEFARRIMEKDNTLAPYVAHLVTDPSFESAFDTLHGSYDAESGKYVITDSVYETGYYLVIGTSHTDSFFVQGYSNTSDDDSYSITITNTLPNHSYAAYQIFAGSLSENGEILSNIKWGSGVDSSAEEFPYAGETAAEVAAKLKTPAQADEFAAALNGYLAEVAGSATVAKDETSCVISGLEPGYYLVKNTSVSLQNGSYTDYIVVVVDDVETKHKNSVPSMDKQVFDYDEELGNGSWGDTADYDIDEVGDYVHYQIEATLPSDYDLYSSYKIAFADTMAKGLSLVGVNDMANNAEKKYVRVFAENPTGDPVDITAAFTISAKENTSYDPTTDTYTLTDTYLSVSCDDITEISGVTIDKDTKIVVYYDCVLNENAVIGGNGNMNTAQLEYSNDPNVETSTGNTPEDIAIVFTYNLKISKIDGDEKPLAGAEFKLEKMELQSNYDNYETLEQYPEAVNKNPPVNLEGQRWRPIEVEMNAEGTEFTFAGLSDGWYRLSETKTPDGFNSIEDIYFVIEAEHDMENKTTKLITILTDKDGNYVSDGNEGFKSFAAIDESGLVAGYLASDVINNAGSTLPETGGMGTTIFYIVGGIMVAAAVVLLVTKKRMSAEG